MKSVLIIGLGRFGRHLCNQFVEAGLEVMVVDQNEALVTAVADHVTNSMIADCTDEKALAAMSVKSFDDCFVCIGSDFSASLLATSLLKEMGARRVHSKASSDIHERLLLRNGADEVIYPERDSAERVAARVSNDRIFDCIELTDGYAIYEISPLQSWIGYSIRELDVRNRHSINILAVKTGGELYPMPGADYRFTGKEHVLALTSAKDARRLIGKP